jgi:hypothetical protein
MEDMELEARALPSDERKAAKDKIKKGKSQLEAFQRASLMEGAGGGGGAICSSFSHPPPQRACSVLTHNLTPPYIYAIPCDAGGRDESIFRMKAATEKAENSNRILEESLKRVGEIEEIGQEISSQVC